MKILFYTKNINTPCSSFYYNALNEICEYKNEIIGFESYEIVLVMTYDHLDIKQIRITFPHIKIGIIDPRNHTVGESVKNCDFLIVDSVEMEDYWRKSHKPIFKYVEFPNIPLVKKTYEMKNRITIGYHGNQVHLQSMGENISPAITNLGKKYDIELLLMYNGQPPSEREKWLPKNVNIKHIEWSQDNYVNQLSKADIGIVPNSILTKRSKEKILKQKDHSLNLSVDDYIFRFKMPSNPGRIIVFGLLEIPVISEFFPSGIKILNNGRGLIAHSQSAWEYCLKLLINSQQLRKNMGQKLQEYIIGKYTFSIQNDNFLKFLTTVLE